MQDKEMNTREYKTGPDRDIEAMNMILQRMQKESSDKNIQEGIKQLRRLIRTLHWRITMYDELIDRLHDHMMEYEELIMNI